jgi:amidase
VNKLISVLLCLGLVACSPATKRDETAASASRYEPTGILAKALPEVAEALASGETTSEALVKAYLERIEAIDRDGPRLQSVLAVNPNAVADARASDARRKAGRAIGALDGVPILLKDNIESLDPMPTTAGALALKENVTGRDSPLVADLRAQGAIILGKTNLSQWANFRSNDSMSGWSALGGQVRNPHMLDRNPCGSSSGSGAAVAASLAAGAVGTETNGSIICPSNANGIVGFKPTVGLVSQQYIVPISPSQDTAGPMTTDVKGAAMLLTAIATGEAKADYAAALDENSLNGLRIGVARYAQGSNRNIIALFDAALAELAEAGAVLVEIKEFKRPEGLGELQGKVLRYEFKAAINAYLVDAAPLVKTRDLDAVIAFNEAHADAELSLFGQDIFVESATMASLDDADYVAARDTIRNASREEGIDKLLADYGVDIVVAPSGPLAPRVDPVNGDVWPDWAGIGSMAAIAGYPHLTVPMGAVRGVPVGISFIGAKDRDAEILSVGYAYEQRSQARVAPRYLKEAEELPEIAEAMRAKPLAIK